VKTQSTCFYFLAWFPIQSFGKAFRPKTLLNIAQQTHTMCTLGLNAISSLLVNTLLQWDWVLNFREEMDEVAHDGACSPLGPAAVGP